VDFSLLSSLALAVDEVDPEGNQSIGWLAGIFTIVLFIVIALLLWSFVRMARKAREPWEGEEEAESDGPSGDSPDDTTS